MNASIGYSTPQRGDRNWRELETDEAGEAFDRRVTAQTQLLRAACEPWLARGRAVRLIYDRTFAFQTRGDMTGRMDDRARARAALHGLRPRVVRAQGSPTRHPGN